jgi:uncharacterized protein (DUF1778 family)
VHASRAANLQYIVLTDFVIRHALRAAKTVIEEADEVRLSDHDSLRVFLELPERPRASKTRLRRVARVLPRRS